MIKITRYRHAPATSAPAPINNEKPALYKRAGFSKSIFLFYKENVKILLSYGFNSNVKPSARICGVTSICCLENSSRLACAPGTEKDNQRAFEKGEISAQEFLVLSAARSFRQAGEQDKTGAFLCSGIDAWAQKKGLSSAAQNEIKRAVLCSSADPQERLNALKQIKTYLDL